MSFRPPEAFAPRRRDALAPSPLEAEVLAEKAAGLGRSGRRVEEALAGLAASGAGDQGRPQRLREAAEAVYYFFIQRELCGLRDHRPVIAHYSIPPEVLARLGAA
jgi:hypothetical protein